MLNLKNFRIKRQTIVGAVLLGFCLPQGLAWAQASEPEGPGLASLQSSVQTSNLPDISSPRGEFYILGPGDEVAITVFGYEEYTETKVIAPDGTITMPLIGSIVIAEQTPAAASSYIASRLNEFLVNPTVTLDTVSLRPLSVTVAGEVQRPGPIQLQSLSTIADGLNDTEQPTLPTLSSALLEAGGVSAYANIQAIQIKRALPGGRETLLTVDLWDDIWANNVEDELFLQDGDDIFVPRLSSGNELDRRLIARSTLAPETVRVRVVGEVKQPGEAMVSPNSSLSSAIAVSGGPTLDANLGNVAFVRLNESGEIERREVDLSDLTDNYQVQDGDVLIVPKRSTLSTIDFVGRLLNPLGGLFSIFNFLGN